MPGRKFNSDKYRYGFNGKEKDQNGEFGSITNYDYGMRIYNPATGRFLSVDPLFKSYPYYTPYQFAGNKPIVAIDVDGLEEKWVEMYEVEDFSGTRYIDRNKTKVEVDRDSEIWHDCQRVAVTHVTIYNNKGQSINYDKVEEVDNNTGLMENGYLPTAAYDLNDKSDTYDANNAWSENGGYFNLKNIGHLADHLATAPEKEVEMKQFYQGVSSYKSNSCIFMDKRHCQNFRSCRWSRRV